MSNSDNKHKISTHQILISFTLSGTCTVVDCPRLIKLLSNPRNTRGGCCALGGKPRYTWLTSFPSTLPVFVILYEIVHAVWNKFAGPPGDVCAGEEIAGGAEEVAVALPGEDVLFAVAVALALWTALLLVAFATAVGAAGTAPDRLDAAGADCTTVDNKWLIAGDGSIATDAETLTARLLFCE